MELTLVSFSVYILCCIAYQVILVVCHFSAGSLASSDLFYDAYGPKGLAREALCPCAGSPETLTVSVRRYALPKFLLLYIKHLSNVLSLPPSDPLLLPLLVVVSCPSLVLAMVLSVLRSLVALHHLLYRMWVL